MVCVGGEEDVRYDLGVCEALPNKPKRLQRRLLFDGDHVSIESTAGATSERSGKKVRADVFLRSVTTISLAL